MLARFLALAGLGAAAMIAASQPALAQDGTYYYCYAYERDNGSRLWVSKALRFVTGGEQKNNAHRAFVQTVRNQTGESSFYASGCRPAYDNNDRGAVEDDRLSFISRERGRGKSVIFLPW